MKLSALGLLSLEMHVCVGTQGSAPSGVGGGGGGAGWQVQPLTAAEQQGGAPRILQTPDPVGWCFWVKVKVLVAQSYLTFCNPMDCSLPGSSGHGILQARYCSGLSFPSPGDLPNPRIEPRSPTLQADSLRSEPPGRFSG